MAFCSKCCNQVDEGDSFCGVCGTKIELQIDKKNEEKASEKILSESEYRNLDDKIWFYEHNGERKGPISENKIIELIKTSIISYGSSVWKKGLSDWQKIEYTELKIHLQNISPPPLSGEYVKNTLVWILAFAPIIGLILEYIVGFIQHGTNMGHSIALDVDNNKYWYMTVGLNISLALFDERILNKAGINTDKFKGWIWLVPVYLYQRAKQTKQKRTYFIVWIVCLLLVPFITKSETANSYDNPIAQQAEQNENNNFTDYSHSAPAAIPAPEAPPAIPSAPAPPAAPVIVPAPAAVQNKNNNDEYVDIIKNFIAAEDRRDIRAINTYLSEHIERYWDILNPNYEEINDRYSQSWNKMGYSKNHIINITRQNETTFVLFTRFEFVRNGQQKVNIKDNRIVIVFDNEKKIIEIYGID